MKTLVKFTCVVTALAFGLTACGGGSKPANTATNASNTSNAAKPATSPANSSNSSNSSSNSSASKTDKPTSKLSDEKPPADGKKKSAKTTPVPESWIYVYDEKKGYGFSVPEGTTGESQTTSGIDVFVAATPAPNEITIFVLAYKDKQKDKEDLLDDAVKFLEGMGVKVTPGELKGESDDYYIADASTVAPDGTKEKQRILVGTDVTDNYVMILNTPDDKFAANEKTIDEIWGSFEIWSGGASAN
jgi:hypothetical protein